MKRLRHAFGLLIVLAGMFALQSYAQPQQPAPSMEKSAPAPLAPLATQLRQTLKPLVDSASAPAPTPTPVAENAGEDILESVPDTFSIEVLDALSKTIDALETKSRILTTPAVVLSDLNNWIDLQKKNSRNRALWSSLSNGVLVIVGLPLLIGTAIMLFLLPLRHKLRRKEPRTLPGRTGLMIGLLFLRLIPVFVFGGMALLLLEQNEPKPLPRFVILNLIYALSLGLGIRQLLRGFFAPDSAHLRLPSLSTPQAISAYRWVNSFCFALVYGYFLLTIANAVYVPTSVVLVSKNVFALILTIMAIIVIFRIRLFVAAILRGTAQEEAVGFIPAMRLWLAQHWHSLATAYLIISLIVTLFGVDNSIIQMLRRTILSVVVLIVARFGFVAVEYWKKPKPYRSPLVHRQVLSFLLRPALWLAVGVGIAATWGVNVNDFIATPLGQRFSSAILSIALTLMILTLLYEMLHGSIERHLNLRDKETGALVASARAQTLLPMIRTSVFVFFSAIAVFLGLSAVGVNMGPLLAGAGIVGVALGFGSQALVKDFLTGMFIVAENSIAVGDIVKIDNFGGVVETLSLRTLRLRDANGALHILPFSEVSKITNMSKGFSYALIDIGIAYDSDPTFVMKVLREIGVELQEDPAFKHIVLDPIEVMGVEAFESSSITIRARIRTLPGKQWDIKRALLLRIKQRFDKEGIEIPFQTITHIMKKTE